MSAMLGIQDYWLFVAAAGMLAMTPGPDTIYVLTRTVTGGRREGMASVFGIISGLAVHVMLAAFGLTAILATSATAFTVVKYIGAAYLLFLGIKSLRGHSAPLEEQLGVEQAAIVTGTEPGSRMLQAFWQGMLTNVLNPKVAIFFLAFLPQFLIPNSGLGATPLLLLGFTFGLLGLLWLLVIVALGASLAAMLQPGSRVGRMLDRVCGGLFIAFGLKLLATKPQAG